MFTLGQLCFDAAVAEDCNNPIKEFVHIITKGKRQRQIHYREVPRWEIFMEQELRFGLDLGQMANFPAYISFDLRNHHIPQKYF